MLVLTKVFENFICHGQFMKSPTFLQMRNPSVSINKVFWECHVSCILIHHVYDKLTFFVYDVNIFKNKISLIIFLIYPSSVSGADMDVEDAYLIQSSKVTNKRPASKLEVLLMKFFLSIVQLCIKSLILVQFWIMRLLMNNFILWYAYIVL